MRFRQTMPACTLPSMMPTPSIAGIMDSACDAAASSAGCISCASVTRMPPTAFDMNQKNVTPRAASLRGRWEKRSLRWEKCSTHTPR